MTDSGRGLTSRLSDAPVAAFVIGGVSLYVGASLAVKLFPEVGAGSAAWLRLFGATIALALITRPWRPEVRARASGWCRR